jgi:3-oxoacyl-[acyl-carrier protein] reductase
LDADGVRGVAAEDGGGDPAGAAGDPEDVGLATLFLAPDSASWLTGVTLDVAGGYVMT